jgi:hypothetical protein
MLKASDQPAPIILTDEEWIRRQRSSDELRAPFLLARGEPVAPASPCWKPRDDTNEYRNFICELNSKSSQKQFLPGVST